MGSPGRPQVLSGADSRVLALGAGKYRTPWQRGSKGFYARRLIRLYPAYLLGIALIVARVVAVGLVSGQFFLPTLGASVGGLLLLQALFVCGHGALAPAWSLSAEAVYYALAQLVAKLPGWGLVVAFLGSSFFNLGHEVFAGGEYYQAVWLIAPAGLAWAWLAGYALYRKPDSGGIMAMILFGGVCNLFIVHHSSPATGPYDLCPRRATNAVSSSDWVPARAANTLAFWAII